MMDQLEAMRSLLSTDFDTMKSAVEHVEDGPLLTFFLLLHPKSPLFERDLEGLVELSVQATHNPRLTDPTLAEIVDVWSMGTRVLPYVILNDENKAMVDRLVNHPGYGPLTEKVLGVCHPDADPEEWVKTEKAKNTLQREAKFSESPVTHEWVFENADDDVLERLASNKYLSDDMFERLMGKSNRVRNLAIQSKAFPRHLYPKYAARGETSHVLKQVARKSNDMCTLLWLADNHGHLDLERPKDVLREILENPNATADVIHRVAEIQLTGFGNNGEQLNVYAVKHPNVSLDTLKMVGGIEGPLSEGEYDVRLFLNNKLWDAIESIENQELLTEFMTYAAFHSYPIWARRALEHELCDPQVRELVQVAN